MSASVEQLPAGVISLSDAMRIREANAAMGDLVGRDPASLVGEPIDVILSAPSRILFQSHVYPALRADGRVEEVFLTLTAQDGDTTPVLFSAVRRPEDGLVTGLLVRIHARARWETELLAATRALEAERAESQRLARDLARAAEDLQTRHERELETGRFRDAFIGVLSHELRTPITTIFGMSHVLRARFDTMATADVRQHLADIQDEADRLQRLTEDLLVMSRAESGRLDIDVEPMALGRVVERTVAAEQARRPDRPIEVEVRSPLPLVSGDEVSVEQIVRNYVGNADKYSPPGRPISVRVVPDDADAGVSVRVVDGGPGLGDDAPELLFEPFYRAPEARRRVGGAGIGLFVCRELARALAGKVWARSLPEGGAEFGLWLPAYDEAAPG